VQRLLLKQRELDKQVRFIYFFGTPQTGVDITRFGQYLSPNPAFRDLAADEVNENLQAIDGEWRSARLGIPTYCAYETKPLYVTRLVDHDSATRNCTEPEVAINENHIGMVKPSGVRHESYLALVNAVRDNPIAIEKKSVALPSTKPRPSVIPKVYFLPDEVYPAGVPLAGIVWTDKYVDVRLDLQNGPVDIENVDFLIKFDTNIAAVGQLTQFPRITAFPPTANVTALGLGGNDASGNPITAPMIPFQNIRKVSAKHHLTMSMITFESM
jgi:hypothetical protein